ncbi:MAG: hypothetical protein NTW38_12110 [Candidatus Aminicenantes bacterium]|nr:hypothetical protein [Candidatus Aminicenantes bacterium]
MDDDSVNKAFEILQKCRELELNHFVSRSNICVLVQGALLAFSTQAFLGVARGASLHETMMTLALAVTGMLLSVFSLRVVKGAYFWVSYWEYRLAEFEEKALPDVWIFRNHPSAHNKALLEILRNHKPPLKYYSSRKGLLSVFYLFMFVWSCLLVVVVTRLIVII